MILVRHTTQEMHRISIWCVGHTRQHLLHVDFALLELFGEPFTVLQFDHLLQAQQEKREMHTILQLMGQICNAA